MGELPTVCCDCDNVAEHTRSKPDWQWLCTKFKRLQATNFINPDSEFTAPYLRCVDVNRGACPVWEPRRTETEPEQE